MSTSLKHYTGKPQLIKTVNQDIILDALRNHPGVTQPQISQQTGISLATVNKTIKELIEANEVVCVGDGESTGGRRAKRYEINQDSGYVVCVYIQGSGCIARSANILGEPQKYYEVEHSDKESWNNELMGLLNRVVGDSGGERLRGIALAVPGTVMNGSVYNIPTIPEWEGVNLEEMIKQEYNCQLTIVNDMNAAAMGVCGKHISESNNNMVFVSVMDTIGASLIVDGRVYSSKKNFTGELSYMVVKGSEKTDNENGALESQLQKALEEQDLDVLLELISFSIVNVCCVVDPDTVVLVCPHIEGADIEKLSALVQRYIKETFLPKILLETCDIKQYLNGLIAICIDGVNRPMQIVR